VVHLDAFDGAKQSLPGRIVKSLSEDRAPGCESGPSQIPQTGAARKQRSGAPQPRSPVAQGVRVENEFVAEADEPGERTRIERRRIAQPDDHGQVGGRQAGDHRGEVRQGLLGGPQFDLLGTDLGAAAGGEPTTRSYLRRHAAAGALEAADDDRASGMGELECSQEAGKVRVGGGTLGVHKERHGASAQHLGLARFSQHAPVLAELSENGVGVNGLTHQGLLHRWPRRASSVSASGGPQVPAA